MNHIRRPTIISFFALACGSVGQLRAADGAAAPQAVAIDEATQKRADGKADRLIAALKLDDPAKAARAKTATSGWYVAVWNWHQANDAQLKDLWSQWNQARSAVPKDEFPAEVIAHQIDDVYATLKPAYHSFMAASWQPNSPRNRSTR